MASPNLFIVGAAKAGTTSLYHYLNQNPEIFFPKIKEPHFFFRELDISQFRSEFESSVNKNSGNHQKFIQDKKVYLELYDAVKEEKFLGDASASYLYSKTAAKEIYQYNPDSKIIIVLRNPIERAFSHYLMNLRMGFSHNPFYEDFEEDRQKQPKGWGLSHLYLELGLYHKQVERYWNLFPKDQLKIILHEDLKDNTQMVLTSIDQFLKLDAFEYNIETKFNQAQLPRSRRLNNFIQKTQLKKMIPRRLIKVFKSFLFRSKGLPKLLESDRNLINPHFVEDLKKLESMCSLNLKSWYE